MRIASRWAPSVTCAAFVLGSTLLSAPAALAAERATEPALIALREAPDPSNAIEAYAEAKAARVNPILAAEAFVRRMVEFGLPEMADAQAVILIQRDPRNALGWGVVAYMETKRGRMDAALEALVRAVRLNPDEVFVLQTAGQLLAWYDVQQQKPVLSDDLAAALIAIRVELDKHPIYTNTLGAAKAAYLQGAPGAADAVAGQPAQPGQPGAVPQLPMIGAQPQFAQQPIVFNPVIQQIIQQPEQVAQPYYPYWWYPVTYIVRDRHDHGHGHGGHGPGHGGGGGPGHGGGGPGRPGGGGGGGAQNPPPAPAPTPVQRTYGRGVSQAQPSLPITGQTRASSPVLGPNPPQPSGGVSNSTVGRRAVGGSAGAVGGARPSAMTVTGGYSSGGTSISVKAAATSASSTGTFGSISR